jgi:hypothetical protein
MIKQHFDMPQCKQAYAYMFVSSASKRFAVRLAQGTIRIYRLVKR